MSLLNFHVRDHSALVAVDTLAGVALSDADGAVHVPLHGVDGAPSFEVSKMLYLPHAGVILASRGSANLLGAVFFACYLEPGLDFDKIAGSMSKRLRDACDAARQLSAAQGRPVDPFLDRNEVALLGWSKRAERMTATVWVNQDGGDFVADDDLEEWVAPWEPSWGIAPSPVDRPTIQALSAAQVARSKMQFSGVAIGGRVLIAELSKDAIRCQL